MIKNPAQITLTPKICWCRPTPTGLCSVLLSSSQVQTGYCTFILKLLLQYFFHCSIGATARIQWGHNGGAGGVGMVHPLSLSVCWFHDSGKACVGWISTNARLSCMREKKKKSVNKQYKARMQTEKCHLCSARIDFTQQLCASAVAWLQWPLTPGVRRAHRRLTSGSDRPQWASLWPRLGAILLPDLSDKAALQKHQLSLNNRSQWGHWLGVSR